MFHFLHTMQLFNFLKILTLSGRYIFHNEEPKCPRFVPQLESALFFQRTQVRPAAAWNSEHVYSPQGHLHSQAYRHTRRNFLKFPSVVVSFCWFGEILRLKATLQRSLLLLRCPCPSLPLGTVRVRSIRSRSHGGMLLAGSLLPGLGLAFPYIPGPPSQEMMSWVVGWALLHRLRHNNSGSLT